MRTRHPRPKRDVRECRVCKKPRPEYSMRPFGWDVHYVSNTGEFFATCSRECRAKAGYEERYA